LQLGAGRVDQDGAAAAVGVAGEEAWRAGGEAEVEVDDEVAVGGACQLDGAGEVWEKERRRPRFLRRGGSARGVDAEGGGEARTAGEEGRKLGGEADFEFVGVARACRRAWRAGGPRAWRRRGGALLGEHVADDQDAAADAGEVDDVGAELALEEGGVFREAIGPEGVVGEGVLDHDVVGPGGGAGDVFVGAQAVPGGVQPGEKPLRADAADAGDFHEGGAGGGEEGGRYCQWMRSRLRGQADAARR